VGRGAAASVDADAYLLGLTRYIHRNPVRAGQAPIRPRIRRGRRPLPGAGGDPVAPPN